MVRTVNHTQSVIEVWRKLVASADFRVLLPERRALRSVDMHAKIDGLLLRWPQEGVTKEGPAFIVVEVCLALCASPLSVSGVCYLFTYLPMPG
jgi:hypothetical protein